jgi:thiol oxidase
LFEFFLQEDQGRPFPVNGDWDHCNGSTPVLRGYTCGLWTVFHVLTISAYKNLQNADIVKKTGSKFIFIELKN